MDDLVNRTSVIKAINNMVKECDSIYATSALRNLEAIVKDLPSAQPTEASCWGCNCQKMERLKEQKTFSEMVHLHDAETHEERTETHACDLISRQEAVECDGFREVERDDERRSN